MQFLTDYHLTGLVIGICTFLIIGIFHPIVIKSGSSDISSDATVMQGIEP